MPTLVPRAFLIAVAVVVFGSATTLAVGTVYSPAEVSEKATAARSAERGARYSVPVPPSPRQLLLERVVELTNLERTSRGLAPLAVDPQLMRAAQGHSDVQAAWGRLSHVGPNGQSAGDRISATGYRWRAYAENLAAGQRTAEEVVAAWIRSGGHRANVLSTSVTEIGVGLAYAADGRPYWTQLFAAPQS